MIETKIRFPKNFLWGVSISAHQTEGNNINDWTEWEHANADSLAESAESRLANLVPNWEMIKVDAQSPDNYISGQADDHYNRYKEDIGIARQLNMGAFRFSVEWSRVEPEEGRFNQMEIDHYVSVVDELIRNGIVPLVTLHHRTNPIWVARLGDWSNKKTVDYFLRYSARMLEAFNGRVKMFTPINEAVLTMSGSYIGGVYPPGKKNIFLAMRVMRNFVSAQNKVYKLIKKSVPDSEVGISHAAIYTEADRDWPINKLFVAILHYLANWRILNKTLYDFIGVQYYTRGVIGFLPGNKLFPKLSEIAQKGPHTDMGWEIYPQGLHNFITQVHRRYRKPIYITENGVADAADDIRSVFIRRHLAVIAQARDEGVDVRGYFYWSLLDNLEWNKGYWPRFGLVAVDYTNFKRTIRPSAKIYAQIIKDSGFVL